MKTDFQSNWNNILLFRDFCCLWKPGDPIFEKNLYSCWWKLIFWLVDTIFFLPFWDSSATAKFIFPSSGNVFLNAFRSVERGFRASGNTFFIYFSDISVGNLWRYQTFLPVFSFSGWWKTCCSNMSNIPSIGSSFPIFWKYVLKESLITASGNGFSV